MSTGIETPVLTVTDAALETILELKAAEDDGDTLALRVEITGSHGADYTYDLSFEPSPRRPRTTRVYQQGDLSVMDPGRQRSTTSQGATLDLPGVPPARAASCSATRTGPTRSSASDIELTGDTAEKIAPAPRASRSTRPSPATAASPR